MGKNGEGTTTCELVQEMLFMEVFIPLEEENN
jgi:hypothetical protein